MDREPDSPLGAARLGGPIACAVGVVLLAIGLLAERSSPGEVAGGPGLPFYALGTLAAFIGLCWSLTVAIVALTELTRTSSDRRRSAKALYVNAAPLCCIALLIAVVWAGNIS